MSTFYFIVQQTMFFAIPLLIVAMGALYSERSGVTNIALEGIMIIGAFTGTLVLHIAGEEHSNYFILLLALLTSAVAGALYSMLHAFASIRLQADQTISGTALNMFAPAFCVFMARGFFGAKQISFTDTFHISSIPVLGDIPVIGPMFFQNCYVTTFLGILVFLVLTFIIKKTRFGIRLRACGENPDAAASAGIDVSRMRYRGVLISGILGGLGGLIFIIPTTTMFTGSVAGYGFLALAVLIMGQWKPWKILPAALFFGILKAIASSYSGISFLSDLPIQAEVYKLIPYVLTLVVLAFSSKKSQSPKAVGTPYDDGKRNNKETGNRRKSRIVIIVLSAVAAAILLFGIGLQKIKEASGKEVSTGYGAEFALVIDADGSIDDRSFSQGSWEGLLKVTNETGKTRKYYESKDNSVGTLKSGIRLAIKGNAKFVVLSGYLFEVPLWELQNDYPETIFCLIDGSPHNSDRSDTTVASNTIGINFAEQESGFLAGYAAVMDGYRNLGFMGGMEAGAVMRYGYGFVTGAEYAAKELGLKKGDVTIRYNYTGSYESTPEALTQASAWYNGGTEIIFACGGSMGNSVMKAGETAGKAVIGVDVDQSGESSSVVISAMKNISGSVELMAGKYIEGTFLSGQNVILTAAEDAVGLSMESSKLKNFTQEQYDEIFEKLAKKEITLYSDSDVKSVNDIPCDIVSVELIK